MVFFVVGCPGDVTQGAELYKLSRKWRCWHGFDGFEL